MNLDVQASQLLARSIAEGKLKAKPTLETLNRIAKVIAPVLAGTPVEKKRRKKVA